jgi:hypothetical protein
MTTVGAKSGKIASSLAADTAVETNLRCGTQPQFCSGLGKGGGAQ